MLYSFDAVDEKIAETEFFLAKMVEAGSDWFSFRNYLSAFLSAARTSTLALQRFKHIPGFDDWYANHREALKSDPLAKFLLETRNDYVHGGPNPIAGFSLHQDKATYHFQQQGKPVPEGGIVALCRRYFMNLLSIVYDCYVVLGIHIDPQQYYTKEHFEIMGKTIEQAETEVWGWVMESYVEEGLGVDDRWHELRSRVGECSINHLFNGYLGKITPQPVLPDWLSEIEYTPEERGWVHVPAGFQSIEEFVSSISE